MRFVPGTIPCSIPLTGYDGGGAAENGTADEDEEENWLRFTMTFPTSLAAICAAVAFDMMYDILFDVEYSVAPLTLENGIREPFWAYTALATLWFWRTCVLGGATIPPMSAVPATRKRATNAVSPPHRTNLRPLDAPDSFPDVSNLNFFDVPLTTILLFMQGFNSSLPHFQRVVYKFASTVGGR